MHKTEKTWAGTAKRGKPGWFDEATIYRILLCSGASFLFGLSGCATTSATDATAQTTNIQPAQSAPTVSTPVAPSPEESAEQNMTKAQSVCQTEYPFKRGTASKYQSCVSHAYQQYMYPFFTDYQRSVEDEGGNNLLAAAQEFDSGAMNMQEYISYRSLVKTILDAKANEDPPSPYPAPDQPSMLNNRLNYDEELDNNADVANDEQQIAIAKLQIQQQTLVDDKYEYQYCAGLHSRNLSDCDLQKMTFQTDLSTYQAMASSIPQASQPTNQVTYTLQQEDMQDDLDAIAGGVVPLPPKN